MVDKRQESLDEHVVEVQLVPAELPLAAMGVSC